MWWKHIKMWWVHHILAHFVVESRKLLNLGCFEEETPQSGLFSHFYILLSHFYILLSHFYILLLHFYILLLHSCSV